MNPESTLPYDTESARLKKIGGKMGGEAVSSSGGLPYDISTANLKRISLKTFNKDYIKNAILVDGKVPKNMLPTEMPNGLATLDNEGKLKLDQLPDVEIDTSKFVQLDPEGKVPKNMLPTDVSNGLATLDDDGKLKEEQLPDIGIDTTSLINSFITSIVDSLFPIGSVIGYQHYGRCSEEQLIEHYKNIGINLKKIDIAAVPTITFYERCE